MVSPPQSPGRDSSVRYFILVEKKPRIFNNFAHLEKLLLLAVNNGLAMLSSISSGSLETLIFFPPK